MQICNRTPVWNTRGSLGAVEGGEKNECRDADWKGFS